ncbi:AbrB/MazE/SpoVT family DNA-binding domain-containing protein [Svornostia abyssi]|uniref:AbrB/MazE/SpoVT family DNA-binding domain-containing protein n=1 Tax=Svornostia abyssi TaxID=2898438 RepID=A0ABY5PEZ9_9ACTN|nr:AbrB/MazE/SpoVT family DNA-binding domain-containing protein [Parviterribacteraceae bacterium J379]
MKATVSEKGQVTIPKPLRERLGIAPGQVLEFEAEQGRLVATKRQDRDPITDSFGVLDLPGRTDDLIEEMRGG